MPAGLKTKIGYIIQKLIHEKYIEWIEQKREVQIKMANILREASIFLSQEGNTRADWLERNGAATIAREQVPAAAPAQAAPTVTTQAEFDALPSGAVFIEDGVRMRKP